MLLRNIFSVMMTLFIPCALLAQDDIDGGWPKDIPLSDGGTITIYQPQPDNFSGNILTARAAVSVKQTSTSDPVFGAIFATATMNTDKDSRIAELESIKITDAKFPSITDPGQVEKLKQLMETEIPKWDIKMSIDRIISSLDDNVHSKDDFNNAPPEVVYSTTPSILVSFDGEPVFSKDDKLKMEKAVNTPFLIVKDPGSSKYYLYGDKFWYTSSSVKSGWVSTTKLPNKIKQIDDQIKKEAAKDNKQTEAKDTDNTMTTPPAIIVTTRPSELIQSDGRAEFANINNTNLLYMKNSSDNIFMDISSQQYYVLLSGRWYKASSLSGTWNYVDANSLPADFAKIPEGSEKDEVLASVPGTAAATEAKLDASIPQTAKVDRKTATTTVNYDGKPKFEEIQGTNLAVAVNTSSTVLRSQGKYYSVDNGVWFVSDSPSGPWTVSADRPADVDKIPPSNSAYNTKYVYIYNVTPDYIYTGYTPGYLGCYIYGPTVVYGTGYYYRPWHGAYYYPRPVTWGFSMHYNPWSGFSIGFGFNIGWFNYWAPFGAYYGPSYWGRYCWFGPRGWYPSYRPPYYGHYYGGGPRVIVNNRTYINNINVYHSNNLYRNRTGVASRNVNMRGGTSISNSRVGYSNPARNTTRPLPANNRVGTNPQVNNNQAQGSRSNVRPNNVLTDRNGNVYRRDNNGNWEQRNRQNWTPVDNNNNRPRVNELNRQNTQRDRGQVRTNNFERSRPQPATVRPSTPSRSSAPSTPSRAPSSSSRPGRR